MGDAVYRFVRAIAGSFSGVTAAVRSRRGTFVGVTLGLFALSVFLPPLVLSVVRKPWDYFAFNSWLKQLPEFLLSSDVPLQRKLEFLPKLALFWFSANDRHGFVEWGFAVDVSDLLRFSLTSLLFGAYFALCFYRRDHLMRCGWSATASRRGGVAGALGSTLGLTTGPCSVMGCGAPVLPVVGLVFAGLSSGTLYWLSTLSRVSSAIILIGMTSAVAYLGWLVSPDHKASRPLPA